jgi:hypothetical protein
MTGSRRSSYARSRKSTSDFERGARQQRVLVSLREQLDIGEAIQNIDALAAAIGSVGQDRHPGELVPKLLGLADKSSSRSIRSVIFTPPFYQTECLTVRPRLHHPAEGRPHPRRRRAGVQRRPEHRRGRDALLAGGRRRCGS